ncbi:hypothetical protein [Streptomyces tendae]|uniref:hypothetical protein n=1 Tax=Streptomyces tendae TaxID=1932 RepID=UPI003EC0DAAF
MFATAFLKKPAAERVESELGPRSEGALYFNSTGTFEVLAVLRGDDARQAMGRTVEWAVTVRHLHTGHELTHCMAWTASDHLISVPNSPASLGSPVVTPR